MKFLWPLAVFMAGALLLAAAACTNLSRAERLAHRGGLRANVIQGGEFRLQVFERRYGRPDVLYVYIEGDGSPWEHGTRVALDPTPRKPLALELANHTPGATLYLGRPCYFSVHDDAGCTAELWTSQRYSARIANSMSAALNEYLAAQGISHAVLIGYSGGGTLAMLMAPRVPATVAVVTVAGNLDPDEWAHWHGYLPLEGSLNPTLAPALPPAIRQIHLAGGRDKNVPLAIIGRLRASLPPDRVWVYADFGHVCCWAQQWPEIFARVAADLGQPLVPAEPPNSPASGREPRSGAR